MANFCKGCGQKLPQGISIMFADSKPVEFEDGFYCAKCAKIKVNKVRQ